MELFRRRRRWRSQQKYRTGAPPPPSQKFVFLGLAIVVLFSILVLQLARLQIFSGQEYQQRAEDNRLREIAIVPPRGLLYDRHMNPLVQNVATFAAVITPADLPRNSGPVYTELERILDVPVREIDQKVKEQIRLGDPFGHLVVKDNLSEDEGLALKEATSRLTGVSLETKPARRYTTGDLTSHVLGYMGPLDEEEYQRLRQQGYQFSDQVGKMGLEYVYETFLRGKSGRKVVEITANGEEIQTLMEQAARPGYNLVLTIDTALQQKMVEVLRDTISPGSSATAVVMDVQNGDVLSMVSLPTFDNNAFSQREKADELVGLLDDPGKPLLNRSIAEVYAPGSTFKLVTGLAALQEGVATTDTTITSRGYITVPHQFDPGVVYRFNDWAALGRLNFYQGLAMSSDVYYYYLAGGYDTEFRGLGATKLADYARAFGLGASTGIDLIGEASGLVPDPIWKEEAIEEAWLTGDTYNFGIGQGYVAATPLQMLNVAAAVANGGRIMRPHIAKQIIDNEGAVIAQINGNTEDEVPIDQANIDIMREAMRQSVEWGVAKTAHVSGLSIGGKTGTAEFGQQRSDGTYQTHGWFIGFAPFDRPEVAIVVFTEQGSGGDSAAPIAGDILDYLFNQSNLALELSQP